MNLHPPIHTFPEYNRAFGPQFFSVVRFISEHIASLMFIFRLTGLHARLRSWRQKRRERKRLGKSMGQQSEDHK